MVSFKNLSVMTALITFGLCITLLFTPEVIFNLFQIEGHDSAFFISRRAAILFLGISIIAWAGRCAPESDSRLAISLGLTVSMIALALIGALEYFRGFVGLGIFLAIVTEVALGAAYGNIWFSSRKNRNKGLGDYTF
ncbi:hypothetical protein [Pseudoalteromonas aurantia]|uniref:DUF4345 domain-containing protein n=1 Tax=Pseudoalteromonas aurantia 208 TaxID=1314867 RepID=A0ABR9EBP3_9GAMM|nr:hypothetical protein [Pseudoalteromonas aurantia]MBE0368398.1 hypothetical protein [Pseudoalteromonas aurantia 208]